MDNLFLRQFDAVDANTVFCFWTGDEVMSENRIRSLWSLFSNIGCPVAYVTKQTLSEWVHPDSPLHPAYDYLSSTHKSDYLRCYFMHHYGGGYTDIKITTKRWSQYFEQLRSSSKLVLGYQEVPHGIPHLKNAVGDVLRANYSQLIGLGAFIFKRRTPLTQAWFDQTNALLDQKIEQLKLHPAQHPQDQMHVILPDGKVSGYPLEWAELLGEVLHPILYKFRDQLLQEPLEPFFGSYR